ncbi:MAG: transposase [bacterium]
MSTREHKQLQHEGCTYYFTTTVCERKHVFIKQSVISHIIDSFLFFQNNRNVLTNGYCIMPNHIHWIFTLSEDMDDAVKTIGTFKSYTAIQILKNLKSSTMFDSEPVDTIFKNNKNIKREKSSSLLKTFFNPNPAKRSTHTFWQQDSDLKAIYSESFLREKLAYIHANPSQEHWSIVDNYEMYPYSSCRYYVHGNDLHGLSILSLL